ncbi:MAG: hypothetical protein WA162_04125 [Thermodesulfobacteriota bacterium]
MTRAIKVLLAVFMTYLLAGCVAAPYQESYDAALKASRYEDAYAILMDVCAKEPLPSVCKDMVSIKARYAGQKFDRIKVDVAGEKKPLSLKRISEFKDEASMIKTLDPSMDVSAIVSELEGETKKTLSAADNARKEAAEFIKSGERIKAADSMRFLYSLDQGAESEFKEFMDATGAAAYEEGVKAASSENWKSARRAFGDVKYISPGYKDSLERFTEAAKKDTYEYHLEEAATALKAGDYDKAIKYYNGALGYKKTDEATSALAKTRSSYAEYLFSKGVDAASNGSPLAGGTFFVMAIEVMKEIPRDRVRGVVVPSQDISRVINELFVKGKEEKAGGNAGLAYAYVDAISKIQPDYPDISAMKEELKAEIRKKSLTSLAVIPFRGPTYNPDAGKVMTSNTLHFLYKELSNDIRILERTAMEALLKESEVKALQGGEIDKGLLGLIDADYLLIGDVGDYRVDSTVADSMKTVRAKTDVKKVSNPEYERWVSKGKSGPEPSMQIEETVYENVKYKVSTTKKTVTVSLGYRIVNSLGYVVYSGMAEKRDEAADDSSEGVEIGDLKIISKVANVPADSEFLKAAQTKVVDDMGADLKKLFSSPEVRLVKEAKEMVSKGNFKGAVENMTKAMFIAEKKGLPIKAMEEEISALLMEGKL